METMHSHNSLSECEKGPDNGISMIVQTFKMSFVLSWLERNNILKVLKNVFRHFYSNELSGDEIFKIVRHSVFEKLTHANSDTLTSIVRCSSDLEEYIVFPAIDRLNSISLKWIYQPQVSFKKCEIISIEDFIEKTRKFINNLRVGSTGRAMVIKRGGKYLYVNRVETDLKGVLCGIYVCDSDKHFFISTKDLWLDSENAKTGLSNSVFKFRIQYLDQKDKTPPYKKQKHLNSRLYL